MYAQVLVDPSSELSARSERDKESHTVMAVTRRLKQVHTTKDTNFPELVSVLHMNRKLWQIFLMDVVDKSNNLPEPLKARIAYLYEFVCIQTKRITENGGSVEPLIDINVSIIRGLSEQWNSE